MWLKEADGGAAFISLTSIKKKWLEGFWHVCDSGSLHGRGLCRCKWGYSYGLVPRSLWMQNRPMFWKRGTRSVHSTPKNSAKCLRTASDFLWGLLPRGRVPNFAVLFPQRGVERWWTCHIFAADLCSIKGCFSPDHLVAESHFASNEKNFLDFLSKTEAHGTQSTRYWPSSRGNIQQIWTVKVFEDNWGRLHINMMRHLMLPILRYITTSTLLMFLVTPDSAETPGDFPLEMIGGKTWTAATAPNVVNNPDY